MMLRRVTQTSRAASRAGFTLMELLVVVAILVILVGVATPMYMSYLERAKMSTARSQAKLLAGDLKAYALSHDGQFPQPGDWSVMPYPPEKIPPMDPWGRPFTWTLRELPQPDGTALQDPVVWSAGPLGNQNEQGEYSSVR
jgi:prepilin-type N-terminal cleavage/methylation domain-containing protein